MAKPIARSFQDRIDDIESGAHRSGRRVREQAQYGVILDKQPNSRRKRRLRPRALPLLRALLILTAMFFGMKVGLMATLGTDSYNAKVESIEARGGVEAWAGWLMAPDPVTLLARDGLRAVMARGQAL